MPCYRQKWRVTKISERMALMVCCVMFYCLKETVPRRDENTNVFNSIIGALHRRCELNFQNKSNHTRKFHITLREFGT